MDLISRTQVSQFQHDRVRHGFFGAQGGVSTGVYQSLNVGAGSDDDPASVQENRTLIARAMEAAHVITAYQVHGTKCVYVDRAWDQEKRPEADAMVTDKPGLALGVLTADCAPVLFHGAKHDGTMVIGAAHAGWRGALAGVLQETVAVMVDNGAVLEHIKAAIGPCIQKKSYEVSHDFYRAFMEPNPDNERYFSAGMREDHPHFDLSGYCAGQLSDAGVKQIIIEGTDTYAGAQEGHFFSCRYAAHHKHPDYGRQMSVVVI